MVSEHSQSAATQEFTAALVEMSSRVSGTDSDRSAVLAEVAEGAVSAIPGTAGAAVVVLDHTGRLTERASFGPLPAKLIALQNQLGEGPTLEAATRAGQFFVTDVANDPRWPRFGPDAAAFGASSMICTPLSFGDMVLGTLSVVADRFTTFDDEAASMASIFATHATLVVANSDKTSQLETALDSRDIIGQAKGILMERYSIDSTKAFSILVRTSKSTNTKLRSVCEILCSTGNLPEI